MAGMAPCNPTMPNGVLVGLVLTLTDDLIAAEEAGVNQTITFMELQKIVNKACECGGEPHVCFPACPACMVWREVTKSITAPTITPNYGTLADYEQDVASALAAYDANPSSKTASDLHAAKDALARRQS